jgi:hypothetical protein
MACSGEMISRLPPVVRAGSLLAVNLLFVSLWGFAAIGKIVEGRPAWFNDKFGQTFLATFPGVKVSFWLIGASELLAFALGVAALLRAEFLERRPPQWLPAMLAWSLFAFVQLGFGLWLTRDYNGGFQQFMYFSGTLVALQFVLNTQPGADTRHPEAGSQVSID